MPSQLKTNIFGIGRYLRNTPCSLADEGMELKYLLQASEEDLKCLAPCLLDRIKLRNAIKLQKVCCFCLDWIDFTLIERPASLILPLGTYISTFSVKLIMSTWIHTHTHIEVHLSIIITDYHFFFRKLILGRRLTWITSFLSHQLERASANHLCQW